MTTPVQNAEAQKAAATAKIARLKQQLAAAEADLALAEGFLAGWEHFNSGGARPAAASGASAPVNPTKEVVANQAVMILRERGEPMTRAKLLGALAEKGTIINGKDPAVVLSTMLWRMKDVVTYHDGFGYWPAGEPLPVCHA